MKTYIKPQTLATAISYTNMIAESTLGLYRNGTGDGADLVKQDVSSSSSSHFSVWDDDWSN